MTLSFGLYLSKLTPATYIGASADGAVMMTFLAPPFKCALAFSMVVNTPVDSITYSAPADFHGISSAFINENTVIECPLTTSLSPFASIVPLNLPCVESYLSK
eukprot:NODE_374_length_9848_cov_0.468971.p10 type:complete len:103 gc:universal NODE_374_length_9848_cov_0.468971:9171-9479(+)